MFALELARLRLKTRQGRDPRARRRARMPSGRFSRANGCHRDVIRIHSSMRNIYRRRFAAFTLAMRDSAGFTLSCAVRLSYVLFCIALE